MTEIGPKRGILKELKKGETGLIEATVFLPDEQIDIITEVLISNIGNKDNTYGGIIYPKVGQEVVVIFLDNQIQRGIILGCLYNAEIKSPLEIDDKNAIIYHKFEAGLEIKIDNTDKKQKILINTLNKLALNLDDDTKILKISKEADFLININYDKSEIEIKAKKISFNSEGPMEIKAKEDIKISSESGNIEINSSNLKLGAKNNFEAKGNQVALKGTTSAELSGGDVTVKASSIVKIN
ncbi:MAG: hypothetical protein RsTaC01_1078 [Candidatus Paraimprobicoccus trichonymphae]|uniref:Gp5/Type VI secretion system Vgr protein OB-fold domain-containing protein n=1 Tax=Candidatus Paraimprobicoccus trichonymphae TaxID=3033793 RepID=A0AA48KWK1_9FIRM|nr:MAG: hypothetical protein RsTaC01_1078 [Candidatus Paraimprobicoccus trichonymphae]